MVEAVSFVKQQPGRRMTPKVMKTIELTAERAKWVETTATRKRISQVEVIEAAIDALRRMEQEEAQDG